MASPTGDSRRYLVIGRQAALDVVPATMVPYAFFDSVTVNRHYEKDIPEFKRNNRWQRTAGKTKTKYIEITAVGRMDSTQVGWALSSLAGPPTGAAVTGWLFEFGQSQQQPVSATNSMYLTLQWGEGLATTWQAVNCVGSKFAMRYAANGVWEVTMTFLGTDQTQIAQIDTAYVPPDDESPFEPYQTVFSIGGVPFHVADFDLTIDNKREPLFGSPLALPAPGAAHGLVPIRFTEGSIQATYSLTGFFEDATEYASGQPYWDAERDAIEVWNIEARDADTDLGGAVHPGFLIDMTRMFGTTPDLDRSQPNVFQKVSGEAFWDPAAGAAGTGAILTLVNAQASYAGS